MPDHDQDFRHAPLFVLPPSVLIAADPFCLDMAQAPA